MIISAVLISYFRTKAYNAVRNAANADISCYYRKKFAMTRLIIVILASALYLIIIENLEKVSGLSIGLILVWGIFCLSCDFPISAIRPYQLKEKHFILYLRGSGRDNYTETFQNLLKTSFCKAFSDRRFIHLLKQYIPVYAVGMTKELEAPIGANIIYLNDTDLEQEVDDLMGRATIIVILLNDSERCLWEIKHAQSYKDKIVYISDNSEILANIRKKLNAIGESHIPIGLKANSAYFIGKDGHSNTIPFTNNDKEYINLIHNIMSSKLGIKRSIFSNRQIQKYGSILGIILFPLLLAYIILVDIHPLFRAIKHPEIFIAIIFSLVFIAIYLLRELLYRKKRNKLLLTRMTETNHPDKKNIYNN
jgi:hypothetical protein